MAGSKKKSPGVSSILDPLQAAWLQVDCRHGFEGWREEQGMTSITNGAL
jgi:hypothetical protein